MGNKFLASVGRVLTSRNKLFFFLVHYGYVLMLWDSSSFNVNGYRFFESIQAPAWGSFTENK
jgi:hypothetical protein